MPRRKAAAKPANPNRSKIAQAEAAQRPVGREQVALDQESYDITVRLLERGEFRHAAEVWREALRTGLRGMDAVNGPAVEETPVGLPPLSLSRFALDLRNGATDDELADSTPSFGPDGETLTPSQIRRASEEGDESAVVTE